MILRLLKVALAFLITLAVFDVVGVGVCFVLDVVPFRNASSALLFAIWFVLGVFCGIIAYGQAGPLLAGKEEKGEWTDRADAPRLGLWIIAVDAGCLVALSGLFYLLWWRFNPSGSYYVPDSAPPTLTFFGTILATLLFSRHLFKR